MIRVFKLGTFKKSLDPDIPKDIYIEFMKNAKHVGSKSQLWIEQDLGLKDVGDGLSYDNISPDGFKFEVRNFGKKPVKLYPSKDIGSKRKYNEDNFRKKVNSIFAFILVDILAFPYITYYLILASDILDELTSYKTISRRKLKKILIYSGYN